MNPIGDPIDLIFFLYQSIKTKGFSEKPSIYFTQRRSRVSQTLANF